MSDKAGNGHDNSAWCWCRPTLENMGPMMMVIHRDLDESWLSSRKFHGGREYESGGDAAQWRHLIP